MIYLTRSMLISALTQMQNFHDRLVSVHDEFEMDMLENLGRRNNIMSQSQEFFVAQEIAKKHKDVVCDGRPGQPDIQIRSLDRELECKLTTRNRSGQISFQTDYETLQLKESLDYLYIVASDDFTKFSAFHFSNLTSEDFRPPSSGARGKAKMNKSLAMKKCRVLVGGLSNNSEERISELSKQQDKIRLDKKARLNEIKSRISTCSARAVKKRENLRSLLRREKMRFDKKEKKTSNLIEYWRKSPDKFSIFLEKVIMM